MEDASTSPAVVSGVCPHDCPDACGLRTHVRDGRAVEVRADPAHPVTRGWLCAKVNPYLGRVYHPQRLLHPLRRAGPKGSGAWQRIGWDEALAEIAARWGALIERHGPEAILPYSYSGTLGLVQMKVASARLWNRLGASRLRRSICMAASERAVRCTLGARRSPPYHQVLDSRLVILWGHNPVSTAPHLMPFLREARRQGTRVVVIDPRRTRSARGADLHLQPHPGSDAALALGLAHLLLADAAHAEDWLRAHTSGWPEFAARLAEYPPARVAAITGIPAAQIHALAQRFARSQPAMIRIGDGINRSLQGGQTVRAIACLPAMVGGYGVRGAGLGCSTGDVFTWDEEAVGHARECPPPGREVNMNRLGAALDGEVDDPPIGALFVFGANPAASAPNAGLIARGLAREDLFTVVHDLFMTDTARYADLVLPATSQLEHVDLHRGYGHTWLAYNRPAIAPRGEAVSNWALMRRLAAALGLHEPWLHQTEDEVIAEVLAASARRSERLADITLEGLRAGRPLPYAAEDEVPFAGGEFDTEDGRLALSSPAFAAECGDPLPGWRDLHDAAAPPAGCREADALTLLSPAAHHFISSSLANQDELARREGAPTLTLHPEDAAARSIGAGTRVEVANARGSCRLCARLSEEVRPGVALACKGWWCDETGRNVNWTTSDALADVAGQSTFHSNRVWVRALGEGG